MAESPRDKTTREVVKVLTENKYHLYATVYLNGDDKETNARTIKRAKRLITAENKNQEIFYFISKARNPGLKEDRPFISFYSHESLTGTKLIKEQEKSEGSFEVSRNNNSKTYISSHIPEYKYIAKVEKLKTGKVFDLTDMKLPEKFDRYGFLNKKKIQ